MKKLSMIMLAALAMGMWSCGNSGSKEESADSTVVSVSPEDAVDEEQTSIGVAIDGAMNSITILDENGDTLNFSYPDLDPAKRVSWSIGDTVTIKYVEVDGEAQVNAVMRGKKP